MVYFTKPLLRRLNGNARCLDALNAYRMVACPTLGIVSPILYFVVPYLVIRMKYRDEKIGFGTYLRIMYKVCNSQITGATGSVAVSYATYLFSMVFYCQSIFTTLEVASTLKKVISIVTERCINLTRFVEAAEALCESYSPLLDAADWGFAEPADAAYSGLSLDVRHPFTLAQAATCRGIGPVLVKFREFDWKRIVPLMLRAFVVDALVSVSKARSALGLCFAQYPQGRRLPEVDACGLWHVCLPAHKAVRNDVRVGGDRPNNVILTGPNAGGKSTFVKGLFVSLVLAQTLTVAGATSFAATPFQFVSTQMNVPDCKGRESLFEAEMARCKRKVDLADASGGRFVALAFDEIFSSTEPVEGVAGAYAIARSLSRHPNVVMFITTHFRHLCKLAEEEDFETMRMTADVDADGGEITFAYRLETGVSEQHVALELLRKKGFDATIVEDAIAVRRSLLAPSSDDGTTS